MAKRAAHISIVVTAYKGPELRLQLNHEKPGRMRVRRGGKRSTKQGDTITPTMLGKVLGTWVGEQLPKAALREFESLCRSHKAELPPATPPATR